MIYSRGLPAILIVVAVIGLIFFGSTIAASKESAKAETARIAVQATKEAKQAEMQLALIAEQEKAKQIRESYEGQAEVIDAQADAYAKRTSADMAFYALKKSEERQDEMLHYIQTGKSLQEERDKEAAKTWRGLGYLAIFGGLALLGGLFFGPDPQRR